MATNLLRKFTEFTEFTQRTERHEAFDWVERNHQLGVEDEKQTSVLEGDVSPFHFHPDAHDLETHASFREFY
jgi:hypothetical protein